MAEKITQADIKRVQEYKKTLDEAGKSYQKLNKGAKDFGKTSKKEMRVAVKDLDDVNTGLEEMEKEVVGLQRSLKKVAKQGIIKKEETVAVNNELKAIEKKILNIYKMKGKGGGPLSGAALKSQKDSIAKLQKQFVGAKGKIKNLAAASVDWDDKLSKVGPAFLRNWASGRKTAKAAGKEVAKMPGLFKAAGAAAKSLGGVLGGVTKMLTGWPGLILGAVKAAIDLTRAADQFVKDANKAFAAIRGPDIMTGDVKKQFKEFNDQIFNAGENIRVGLDVTQIREFLFAAKQAGANITDLNKGLLNYRDAIYVASKASKVLGLELPMVGDMMGKMIVDMRMDLDKMNDAFVQVAFDAKKSGLSVDRFWTTVQNASASLALYGVVVKTASQTMKAFTENMVGGADDAAEATDNMFEVFKTGGLKAQMALIQFAKSGGANVPKIFQEMAKEAAGRVEAVEGEIKLIEGKGKKRTPEDVEQLKKLRSELYAAQSKQNRLTKAAQGGTAAQAAEAGALAKRAPEMIISAIKGQVGTLHKLEGHSLLVAIQAGKAINMSEKTIRMLVEISKTTKERMTDLASKSATFFNLSTKGNEKTREVIATAITDVTSQTGDDQIEAADALQAMLENKLNMMPDMATDMVKLIKNDKESASEITKHLQAGNMDMSIKIGDVVASNRAIEKMTAAHFKDQEKTETEMADAAEDTFKGIVEQTLSYNEMVKIAKDEVLWRLSSIKLFAKLNSGVWNILGFMTRNEPYLTREQRTADESLKQRGIMIKKDTDGNFLLSDIGSRIKKGTTEAEKLKADIKEQTAFVNFLADASKKDANVARALGKGMTKLGEESKIKLEALINQNAEGILAQKAIVDNFSKLPGNIKKLQEEIKAGEAKQTAALEKYEAIKAKSTWGEGKRTEAESLFLEKGVPQEDPGLEKMRNQLKKDQKALQGGEQKARATLNKMEEGLKKKLPGMLEEAKKTEKRTKDQLTEVKNTNKELITLNGEAEIASEIARMQLLSTEEGRKAVRKKMKGKTGDEAFAAASAMGFTDESINELKETMQEGVDLREKGFTEAGVKTLMAGLIPKFQSETIKEAKEKTAAKSTREKTDFFDITKGGFVNVKSGDILVDKNSLAQGTGGPPGAAMPALAAAAGGAPGVPGSGTTININVVATEKDLAGKIANQIKKELYNRQISTSPYSLA